MFYQFARFVRTAIGVLFCMALLGLPQVGHADEWESRVNGQGAYDKVQAILKYKQAQAREVESIFYGLRDSIYVASPTSKTTYTNNSLTPNSVDYTVQVSSRYNQGAVGVFEGALRRAKHLRGGQTEIKVKFSSGTVTINLFDEVLPIYERLTRGGYSFEARAVLMDNEQTVIATSDNSLLLSVRSFESRGLDFSKSPFLRTYQKAEPPDVSSIVSDQSEGYTDAIKALVGFVTQPTYRLSASNKATFYSLRTEDLKDVTSCRVLRESDELLVYKRDK